MKNTILAQSENLTMNNPIKTIIRYELARQNVKSLSEKVSYLVQECEYLDTSEDHHGMIIPIGETCGQAAWDLYTKVGDDSVYEDCFFIYIRDENGACDKCLEARKIKSLELASAKKEFGISKRLLSHFGKKLISEGVV